MPERLEEAVYGGLSPEEQDQIEKSTPSVFKSPEVAISWSFEKGAFSNVDQAKAFYDKIKQDRSPRSAKEMRDYWIEAVEQRIREMATQALDALDSPNEDDPF